MSPPTLLGLSLLLIVAAGAALVIGWSTAGELLVYLSVAASAGAGLLMLLAHTLSKQQARRSLKWSSSDPSAGDDDR